MHLKRWLTGIIALPILVFLITCPLRLPFYTLLYLASLVGLTEFYRMTVPDLPKFVRWSSYFLTFLLFVVIYERQILLLPGVIVLWAFIPMAYYMLRHPAPTRQSTSDIGKAVLGPLYVSIPLTMLLHIDRYYPKGSLWIFFLLTVIFASDTGAFYAGKFFGKHKLYEAISPRKTWEGAIGGLLSSLMSAFFFLKIIALHRLDMTILILAASLSVGGQIGDLSESMLKRNYGVKDSGHILPGHGGILDRIDGLLFCIPVLYVYLSFSII
jgi:phosphatidate cytidylyltransferase